MANQDQVSSIARTLQTVSAQIASLQAQLYQLQGSSAPSARVADDAQRRYASPPARSASSQADAALQVQIVPELCRGCGLCARMAPHTFALDAATRRARVVNPGGDPEAAIRAAVANCPTGALRVVS